MRGIDKLEEGKMEPFSVRKKPIEFLSTQSFFFRKHCFYCSLDTQFCTPLSSTRFKYVCTTLSFSSYKKTVCCCSLSLLWLIGSLWHMRYMGHTLHHIILIIKTAISFLKYRNIQPHFLRMYHKT